jgi:hypothetical protein
MKYKGHAKLVFGAMKGIGLNYHRWGEIDNH